MPPVASFSVAPTSGTKPLFVVLDATASVDPECHTLTYQWDFGDGTTFAIPEDTDAAVASLRLDYKAADDTRIADDFDKALELYLKNVAGWAPLLSVTKKGAYKNPMGASEINRVANGYLGKIAHDLGGMYLYQGMGMTGCDRYTRAFQYSHESAQQYVDGDYPQMAELSGTNLQIQKDTEKLNELSCPIPEVQPMFPKKNGDRAAKTVHHFLSATSFELKLTVNDGAQDGSTSKTISVTP